MRKEKLFFLSVMAALFLSACGEKEATEISETTDTAIVEEVVSAQEMSQEKELSIIDVMNRIITEQGLENAISYNSEIEAIQKDSVIFLCKSESGKYEAYGFISPEYGKKGILINNIIDEEGNWNYFEEKWSYSEETPFFEEVGEYEVNFNFNQNGEKRTMRFDTHDTGTMSLRED